VLGAADADILVSLKEHHHPTAAYVRELRQSLPRAFPGVTLYFLPADMVTQILNFGLPAPVDIHIEGTDLEGNHQVANSLLNSLSGSSQITPMFFLNWQNGVSYNLVAQTPQ
jgi:hypothetical protein